MSVTLAIEPFALSSFDAHLVQLPLVRLIRSDEGITLACADDEVADAVILVARAGARAVRAVRLTDAPAAFVPAVVDHLAPVKASGVIDLVTVRRLEPGEASASLGRGPWRPFGRRGADAGTLRAVLHRSDTAFAWRRVIWARPATFRTRALRGIRPAVFDRGAITRARERNSLASLGELTRWMSV
ncbi:MAG TPA: hypothetical protein VM052_08300 [Candidatus Limnocylindrales bacterium]|nr:hypothetical protein [Candidatus Limnocylindrales bacterium]